MEFLDKTPKAQAFEKLDYTDSKLYQNFCTAKGTLSREKTIAEWKKIFSNYSSRMKKTVI